MQVILQEDFPQLGYIGDVVSVRRGFARNFLIPRSIAIEVGTQRAKELKHKVAVIDAKKAKAKVAAQKFSEELSSVRLKFKLKIGSGGKAFGAITSRDIAEKLKKEGHNFDRKSVKLEEPIRSAGEFRVDLKLHSEVTVAITVEVEAEKSKAAPAGGKKKDKARSAAAEGESAEETDGSAGESSDDVQEGADAGLALTEDEIEALEE